MSMTAQVQANSTPTLSFTPVRSNLLQRKWVCGGTPGLDGECAECRKKRLQRRSTGQAEPSAVPPIVHEVLRSPGKPLDTATRALMERRFGHDFSRVQVHTDDQAARSAQAINAFAYTVGRDVVFGAGQYAPSSGVGQRLLAHELAHVVQHGQQSRLDTKLEIGAANDPLEREADQMAQRMAEMINPPAAIAASVHLNWVRSGLQRQAAPQLQLEPVHVDEFRLLIEQFRNMSAANDVTAVEAAEIETAIAEAETALVAAEEVAAAGTGLIAAAETSTVAAGALAADDVTGIGVADDVAIPFVLLGAAIMFGIGYAIGSSADEIAAVWNRAKSAVERTVQLILRAVSSAQRQPQSQSQAAPQSETQAVPSECVDKANRLSTPNCQITATLEHSGDDPLADLFCEEKTGDPCEYRVRLSSGARYDAARFDAIRGRDVYECKCWSDSLVRRAQDGEFRAQRALYEKMEQTRRHIRVTKDCGLQYRILVSSPAAAEYLRSELGSEVDVLQEDFEPCD